MKRKGFTLLELVVVVIILGILATLGFTQYTKMVEKGRTAESKMILGQIRTAQAAYTQQYGSYTGTIASLSVEAPIACSATHYFIYTITSDLGTATRCTTASGKTPPGSSAYTVTLAYTNGVWGGAPGMY